MDREIKKNSLVGDTKEIVDEAYKRSGKRLNKETLINSFYENICLMTDRQISVMKGYIKTNPWERDFSKAIDEYYFHQQ